MSSSSLSEQPAPDDGNGEDGTDDTNATQPDRRGFVARFAGSAAGQIVSEILGFDEML